MRYSVALLLTGSASLVAAQNAATTPTAGNSNCASQKLVDSCVSIMNHGLAKCRPEDWDCKCSGAVNIANCYMDCSEDDEAGASARSLSAGNCATANAYDHGETTVAPTWTLPGSDAAQPTDTEASPTHGGSSTPGPTDSPNANKKSAETSEGAASVGFANSWLALIGLGLGVVI